jgi:hypothetical protein
MGAHSTLMITRSRALAYLRDSTPTDDELAREMDARLYDRVYNCIIVDDDYEDNDDGVL